jgi:Fe-S oxidoreductase
MPQRRHTIVENPNVTSEAPTLEDALYRCNKCGFCQATCPHYEQSREEWTVARGQLRLIRGALEGRLPVSEGLASRLYQCFMCGSCSATCPSGVEVEKVALQARRDLAQRGLLPAQLVQLGETITATGGLTGETGDARLSWAQNLSWDPPTGGAHEVLYFVGCVSSLYPRAYRAPQAMVGLLDSCGADYAVLGAGEVCCGFPLYIAGLVDEAREVAEANLARVTESGAKTLITTCPSCFRMWREFYPSLLGESPPFEVVHAIEWLAQADLDFKDLGRAKKAAFHDPCDLGRGSGIYDAPRELLSQIDGIELVEMARNRAESLCCGGGGNMESLSPEMSQAVARERVAQAVDVGADLLVTACPQCERTLASGRPKGSRISVIDIVELAYRSACTEAG